ncbi:hypothetical protein CBR_g45508 [Chara braunii]|uniref:Uncharacterized protein n=1 Tax=Chara braunii TaxID=69332 RepID=A0A388LYP6_CHABU|nr:hypothetical protein CBR_g45508 [Chara braunii]|eukprot:GBG87450.1 hypothetical protein CBR_g45508 [Chara braunii]
MADLDSWEDMDEGSMPPPGGYGAGASSKPAMPRMNPNASSFSFNPGASSFTPPSYGPGPQQVYGGQGLYGPGPQGGMRGVPDYMGGGGGAAGGVYYHHRPQQYGSSGGGMMTPPPMQYGGGAHGGGHAHGGYGGYGGHAHGDYRQSSHRGQQQQQQMYVPAANRHQGGGSLPAHQGGGGRGRGLMGSAPPQRSAAAMAPAPPTVLAPSAIAPRQPAEGARREQDIYGATPPAARQVEVSSTLPEAVVADDEKDAPGSTMRVTSPPPMGAARLPSPPQSLPAPAAAAAIEPAMEAQTEAAAVAAMDAKASDRTSLAETGE